MLFFVVLRANTRGRNGSFQAPRRWWSRHLVYHWFLLYESKWLSHYFIQIFLLMQMLFFVVERANTRGRNGSLQAPRGWRAGHPEGGFRVHVHAPGDEPRQTGHLRVSGARGERPQGPLRHQNAHLPHAHKTRSPLPTSRPPKVS